jgi:hypothetical protein
VLFSMIANYQLMRQKMAPDGVMPFCRSIGRPMMEEFMFSYSWKRDPDVVRTLAKALSSAGVGVWIGSCSRLQCSTVEFVNALFALLYPRRREAVSRRRNSTLATVHGVQGSTSCCVSVQGVRCLCELLY